MTYKIALSAGVIAVCISAPASAHHPGGTANSGNAGPINTIPATTLEQGHVSASVLYEFIRLGGLGDADLIAAAAAHQHAHSIGTIASASLGAAYGITNDLMLSFRLPFVRRTDIREGHHSHGPAGNTVDFRGDAAGIGDLTVLGQWRFFNNPATATEAAVLFGVKLPTGRTEQLDRNGVLFETEFQPGSGSFDALVGLALTQRFGAWSFDANVLYAFAGNGAQDTNLGDRFQYNAAVSYRLFGGAGAAAPSGGGQALSHSPEPRRRANPIHVHDRPHSHTHDPPPVRPALAIDAVLELNGEWHDRQVAAGVRDPNSGGNVVYVSPGLRLSYGGVSGFTSFGLPVINEINGLQSKPSWRVVTGLAATF